MLLAGIPVDLLPGGGHEPVETGDMAGLSASPAPDSGESGHNKKRVDGYRSNLCRPEPMSRRRM